MSKYTMRGLQQEFRNLIPSSIDMIVGFDTETWKIANQVAPKTVCYTFCYMNEHGVRKAIMSAADGAQELKKLLLNKKVHFAAHNAAFDFAVCSVQDKQLFALATNAYKQGRVHCTLTRQKMLNCADIDGFGEVGIRNALSDLVLQYLGLDISDSKSGGWRLRFKELDDTPIAQWPQDAVTYAMDDAEYAAYVLLAQTNEAKLMNQEVLQHDPKSKISVLRDAPNQAYIDFIASHISMVHGVRINETRIASAYKGAVEEHDSMIPELLAFGLLRKDQNKSRGYAEDKSMLQRLIFRALCLLGNEMDPKFYSSGHIGKLYKISCASGTRDTLNDAIESALRRGIKLDGSRFTDLEKEQLCVIQNLVNTSASAAGFWKEISTFISAAARAKLNPDSRLRYKLNGLVSTGRTSSSNPNLQNLPRNGTVRSCIEPTPGHVFLISDYSAAEFRTLGQINQDEAGYSVIAKEYQADRSFDPHLFAAIRMYKIQKGVEIERADAKKHIKDENSDLGKELKKLRQLAKALNFGLAGGLSPEAFISYARGYNFDLTLQESQDLCNMWFRVWVEMDEYKSRRMRKYSGSYAYKSHPCQVYVFPRDGRARFCNRMTVSMNTPFQGLAASGIKAAMRMIFEECHFVKTSPLFGCTITLMIHDELVLEAPHDGSQESLVRLRAAAARFEQLMIAGMEKFTPDVPAEAEVAISTRWTKEAKSARDENGELLVWEPEEEEDNDNAALPELEDGAGDEEDTDDVEGGTEDSAQGVSLGLSQKYSTAYPMVFNMVRALAHRYNTEKEADK